MPSATALAHPNIALIKYWGKRDEDDNLPAVGSLSVTLDALRTRTTVSFEPGLGRDELTLNGVVAAAEHPRLTRCLDALRALAQCNDHARVDSENDFPTGAGLASSASGYAALTVAGAAALGIDVRDSRLEAVARIGSGSAPRSLHGGFVLLENTATGTRCEPLLAPADWPLHVVVAVTSESGKSTSSRDGMADSRRTSPYYEPWVASHAADLAQGRQLVRARDFAGLAQLAEHNCLKMHAVMLTTRPPLVYWLPVTLACIEVIGALRRDGVPVFYTIDAGPQVKAVCLPEAADTVAAALRQVPGVLRLLTGGLGTGARIVDGNG
ncbi:MAG: diphosphomevalonate decarboxylase [Chromatiales bacterium]|nr:MAG: diphosphomevalonate decarboxylase [Chromatiales bacterium]